MRKNLLKKVTAAVLSLTMIVGMTGVVSAAPAANGQNVAAGKKWTSFSVKTMEDGGKWYNALVEEQKLHDKDIMSYTEGWVSQSYDGTELTATTVNGGFRYYVANSGWDGEYYNGNLVADNPWGMTATLSGVPIEKGRYYTISFKIKSTLKTTNTVTDENGNEVKKTVTTKHISFKAYDPVSPGEPSVVFKSASGATTSGWIELDSAKNEWKTVTATILIDKQKYGANEVGVKFALGANLKTYPDEINMKGDIYVKDFKIEAGKQWSVKYTDPATKKSVSTYVNDGEKASSYAFTRKNYTLAGYKNGSSTYNFNTPVKSNLNLTAVWKKTAKPAKAKIKKITGKKKKAVVSIKKVKNAVGYQIKYAQSKNMKGSKTKTTTKASYTLKKLKSGKKVYVQVRAYVLDSAGNKVYGKYSAKKNKFIK